MFVSLDRIILSCCLHLLLIRCHTIGSFCHCHFVISGFSKRLSCHRNHVLSAGQKKQQHFSCLSDCHYCVNCAQNLPRPARNSYDDDDDDDDDE